MELIVVIVILAILAAILIPGLLKWIDQAKDKKYELEAREIVLAAEAARAKAYADGSIDCECGDAGGIVAWHNNNSTYSWIAYNWMKVESLKLEIEKLTDADVKLVCLYGADQTLDSDVSWSAKNFEIYFVSSDNTKIYARYFVDFNGPRTNGWEITKNPSDWDDKEKGDWLRGCY